MGVYTTNIDNLIPKIVSANPQRYLHNQAQNGIPTDCKAIPYLPLHGCVEDAEPNFVFDVVSLANIYGEFYQFNLSSCIRQQNSLTAQFVSFSLSNLANIFYPPPIFTIINLCLL